MKTDLDILDYLSKIFRSGDATTPKHIVTAMLDLIPPEVFADPTKTFLCPATKDGIFLREILHKIIAAYGCCRGAINRASTEPQTIRQILETRIFGISLTYKDYVISRRTLYGCTDDENEIGYRDIDNIFYDTTETLSEPQKDKLGNTFPYQYTFIKMDEYLEKAKATDIDLFFQVIGDNNQVLFEKKEKLFDKLNNLKNMKFDVIIGNPPYQISDGSGAAGDAAIPIYNKFIEQAINQNPNYLSMIIPSKWMVGGRGLDSFRNKMIADNRIKYLFDFENGADCFPSLHIDGGVCYFLWEKNYNGTIDYSYKTSELITYQSNRYLKNDYFQYIIRDSRRLSIIEKVSKGKRFSDIVSSRKPFGIETDLFNDPKKYPESKLQFEQFENSLKLYGVKGIKGGATRIIGYVVKQFATNSIEAIDNYKLFISKTYSTNAINPPEIILGERGSICTSTFLMIGSFETEQEQKNCLSYINTNFFKVLLYFGKGTMNVTQSVFELIPLQDFSESWNDEKLYAKYGLNQEEIDFIESMIRPMDLTAKEEEAEL